jgi:DNA-binding transcriptional LysR family regulator
LEARLGRLQIDLRHLAALQALSEERSFQRAALKLGYTQSAVSQQLAALERSVNRRLVNRPRGAQGLTLTEAGAVLLKHAAAIDSTLSVARADLAALDTGTTGSLRIGTFQSAGIRLLPEILRQFTAKRNEVDVVVTEGPSDDTLLPLVERGELDVTFAELPLPGAAFTAAPLVTDRYVLVVPRDSPLAGASQLTLPDIAELPLVGFKNGRSAERIVTHFQARGLRPTLAMRLDDNEIILAIVASGIGGALMPALAVHPDRDDVRVLELADDLPPRVIAVAWHADRGLSPAGEAFVATARAVADGVARRESPQPLTAAFPSR